MAKLTPKQQQFVDEYLIDLNATQAAIRAGYSVKTAARIAIELLNKTHVSDRLRQRMADRERRTEITQDRVLQELAAIGFSDIKDYLSFRTEKTVKCVTGMDLPVYEHVVELNDSAKVDGRVISEVTLKDGALKFKMHDKMTALDKLGKHLGMFTEKLEVAAAVTQDPYEGLTTEELRKLVALADESED